MMRLPSESFINAELEYRAGYRPERRDVARRSAPVRQAGTFWHRRQRQGVPAASHPGAAGAVTTAPATRPLGASASVPAAGVREPSAGAAIVDIATRRRSAA